ncbi:hypothetical protein Cus16_0222 [Curtobacterium sp. ER1/6]|nr:hypothetical protein Cus16_0222 [Curtobacterium sp. ER1/6]
MVGPDRQLPVAAVDEHREPDRPRAPDALQGVEGSPDRPPGVEHVVDEHDDLAVDAARRDGRAVRRTTDAVAEVVPVHRHVERAEPLVAVLGPLGFDVGQDAVEPLGQDGTSCRDTQEHEVRGPVVGLEDLVRDACQSTRDVGLLQDRSGTHADLLPRLTGRT